MQRVEDYNLLGSRLPEPPPPSTVDQAEVRRVMAEVNKRTAARAATTPARSIRRPVQPGPLERRPASMSIARSGVPRLPSSGRGVVWALRTLQRMPESEMRARFQRDPEGSRELVVGLDRLLAVLEADGC